MPIYEFFPGVRGTVRTRGDAFFFEDVPDCLTADLLDPHFPEFTDNPCVPEPGGFGDMNDEFSQLSGLPLSAFGIGSRLLVLLVPHPAIDGFR